MYEISDLAKAKNRDQRSTGFDGNFNKSFSGFKVGNLLKKKYQK